MKFTLQEQCFYQNNLFPGNCRRRSLLGEASNSGCSQPHPWFHLPYEYWFICIFTENLCCCIWMFSELMNWASYEVLSPLYGERNWEREMTYLRSHKMSGELWKMHSSLSLGDARFLPVTILAPSGCAIFGRVQQAIDPIAQGLMMVSRGSFRNSSTPSLHMLKSLSICSLSDL